jgi:hypothetical protein
MLIKSPDWQFWEDVLLFYAFCTTKAGWVYILFGNDGTDAPSSTVAKGLWALQGVFGIGSMAAAWYFLHNQ